MSHEMIQNVMEAPVHVGRTASPSVSTSAVVVLLAQCRSAESRDNNLRKLSFCQWQDKQFFKGCGAFALKVLRPEARARSSRIVRIASHSARRDPGDQKDQKVAQEERAVAKPRVFRCKI